MKCISLLQPWASLVVLGHKKIETRSWNTKYRGPLLIHASAKYSHNQHSLAISKPFFRYLKDAGYQFFGLPGGRSKVRSTMPLGAIIGQVNLYGTETTSFFEKAGKAGLFNWEIEQHFGDYSPNRYGWLLSDFKQFKTPIPAKGQLGLWEYNGIIELV